LRLLGCLTHVNDYFIKYIGRIWAISNSSLKSYFLALVLGEQKMTEKLKGWGIAFIIGATLGMIVEQQIIVRSIQKDCSVLLAFRINDLPYTCKPYLSK